MTSGGAASGTTVLGGSGGGLGAPLVCHGHTRPIVNVHCSKETPDGIFLASASKDGEPQIRNGVTGDWIGTFQGHNGAVWSCVLNDSAFVAATGSADFSARVWNAVTGDELVNFPHKHIVRTTAFERSSTGTKLMTGGAEKIVRLFDLGKPGMMDPVTTFGPAPDSIRSCMWSGDNRRILLSYLDEKGVDVIDLSSGTIVDRLDSDTTTGPVLSMEYTWCGKYLVTAQRHSITVRDAFSLAVVKQHTIESYEVEAASYCPEKNMIVAGGSDMWVHVYNADTGEEMETGRGHHGPVHCMHFSPLGDSFISGSEDGTIRIWKL